MGAAILILFVGSLASFASAQAAANSTPPPLPQAPNPGPAAAASLLTQARAEIQRKNMAKAETDVRAYLAQQPNSATGHFLLGYILSAEKKPKRSLAEYTQGARFHRPSADDLVVVAADYVYLHDYADADKWLTLATTWKPDSLLDWYYLGRAKYNENRFQEAVDAFHRCLQLDPVNVRAEDNLGLAYEGLQDDQKAAAAYRNAIEWQSKAAHPYPQPYLNLGILLARKGRAAEALPYLERAVELAPQNPKAHEQLGKDYEAVHRFPQAQAELEKAIAIAPDVSSLHYELGRIYSREKKSDDAKREFARCAVLNGTHSTDAAETPNPDSQN
jgi:tetratricopeptide (TPR) repeat protein